MMSPSTRVISSAADMTVGDESSQPGCRRPARRRVRPRSQFLELLAEKLVDELLLGRRHVLAPESRRCRAKGLPAATLLAGDRRERLARDHLPQFLVTHPETHRAKELTKGLYRTSQQLLVANQRSALRVMVGEGLLNCLGLVQPYAGVLTDDAEAPALV